MSKTKVQQIRKKILRHKKRRLKHQENLLRLDLTLKERAKHEEGVQIQTAIIDHLKKIRTRETNNENNS